MQTKLGFAVESKACSENPEAAGPAVSASDFLPPFDPEDYDGMTAEELLTAIRWGTALLDSLNGSDDL